MTNYHARTHTIAEAPIVKLLSDVIIPDDCISLGQGIPFFGPPDDVIQSVKDQVTSPVAYQYTEDAGLFSLREKIAQKLMIEQKVDVSAADQIMVTTGANQAFFNALLSVTNPSDEVILFQPTYFNYVMAVQMAGCKPVIVNTDDHFLPSIEHLKESITSKTRVVVTISPNNPTGAVYPFDQLKMINEVCADGGLFHISDEVYEYFVYDDAEHVCPLKFDDDIDHTISLFSFSKAFGMSGYRIGYMVMPRMLYTDCLKVQDTIGISAPSLSQLAAEKAIDKGRSYCSRFFSEMKKNRHILRDDFSKESDIFCSITNGAYYVLLSYHADISSWELSKRFIEEFGVLVLPGSIFRNEFSLRISYGNLTHDTFQDGVQRLIQGFNELIY